MFSQRFFIKCCIIFFNFSLTYLISNQRYRHFISKPSVEMWCLFIAKWRHDNRKEKEREKHADGVTDVRPEKVISDAFSCRSKQLVIFKSIKCHPRCYTVNKSIIRWLRPKPEQQNRNEQNMNNHNIFIKVEAWKTVRNRHVDLAATQNSISWVSKIGKLNQLLSIHERWTHKVPLNN